MKKNKETDEDIGSDLISRICVSCFSEISDQNSKNINDVIGVRHEALPRNESLGSCVVRLSSGENTGASNGEA